MMSVCKRAALAVTLFLWPAVAQAGDAPWIIYGQTPIAPNSAVCNPPTNTPGTKGEATLPYIVPIGQILVIEQAQAEALTGAGIVLYFNDPTCSNNAKASHTLQFGPAHLTAPPRGTATPVTQDQPIRYYLPAGVSVSVRLSSNWNYGPGTIYGWYVRGHLEDAP